MVLFPCFLGSVVLSLFVFEFPLGVNVIHAVFIGIRHPLGGFP